MEENNNTQLISNKKERIFELDALRGLAVIAMIIDHFLILVSFSAGYGGWCMMIFKNYNDIDSSFINTLVKIADTFEMSTFREVCHYIFVTLFLTICGISCTFSKSNVKRGIKIIGAGLIVTLATVIISKVSGDEFYIIFGILSTLGISVLLYALCEKIYDNKWLFLIIGCLIILWGFLINWWDAPRLNNIHELNFSNIIKMILGYVIYGEDCFGLVPCTGVVFIGAFIGKTLYKDRKTKVPKLKGKWVRPFTFVGTHALWVYLLHQVLAVIIIFLLYVIAGYRI